MMRKIHICTIATILAVTAATMQGQTIRQELRADNRRTAGNYLAYPEAGLPRLTPPPQGKKPFYINHFGSCGSYYCDQPKAFDEPFMTLAHADSLGKLTPTGRDVMGRIGTLRRNAHNRWGELSEKGVRQQRDLAKRMVQNFPDIFADGVNVSARSSTVSRSILSMEQALLQIAMLKPMTIRHKASKHHKYYINPAEPALTAQRMDSLTTLRYQEFAVSNETHGHLMATLFNDTAYVAHHVNATALNQQLFDLAGTIQNTGLEGQITLYDIFTEEERYRNWRQQNAWWYINFGGCTLNGGKQPYLQRQPLRKMIAMGDSIVAEKNPVVHLRYTMETVIMSLACLMELNGYGLATDDLESLDERGWADYRICPMGSNIQMIHYRSSTDDTDVLVKVLLNEREATLPVSTDCAPYYHWNDVRRYYLRKLDEYEDTENERMRNERLRK